jgi:hypothetical protein
MPVYAVDVTGHDEIEFRARSAFLPRPTYLSRFNSRVRFAGKTSQSLARLTSQPTTGSRTQLKIDLFHGHFLVTMTKLTYLGLGLCRTNAWFRGNQGLGLRKPLIFPRRPSAPNLERAFSQAACVICQFEPPELVVASS